MAVNAASLGDYQALLAKLNKIEDKTETVDPKLLAQVSTVTKNRIARVDGRAGVSVRDLVEVLNDAINQYTSRAVGNTAEVATQRALATPKMAEMSFKVGQQYMATRPQDYSKLSDSMRTFLEQLGGITDADLKDKAHAAGPAWDTLTMLA